MTGHGSEKHITGAGPTLGEGVGQEILVATVPDVPLDPELP